MSAGVIPRKNRSFIRVEAHALALDAGLFEGTEPARIGALGTAVAYFEKEAKKN
jgi:hypothetical protein